MQSDRVPGLFLQQKTFILQQHLMSAGILHPQHILDEILR